jgi:hypothetical protein
VAPAKLVPVIVIVVAGPPEAGVNEETAGAGMNVKPPAVPTPPAVVTVMLPEVPDPTTAVMLVAETTVYEVAFVPPNLTAVALVKFVPVIVIVLPGPALAGVNEVTVGAGTNVKPVFVPVPPCAVTNTLPEVPEATTAVIVPEDITVNEVADVPPKRTIVAPVKLLPLMVTVVPAPAAVGVNELTTAAG